MKNIQINIQISEDTSKRFLLIKMGELMNIIEKMGFKYNGFKEIEIEIENTQ